jgi:hypothetical protein
MEDDAYTVSPDSKRLIETSLRRGISAIKAKAYGASISFRSRFAETV